MDEQEKRAVSLEIFQLLAEPMIIKLTLKNTPPAEINEKLSHWTGVLLEGYRQIRRAVDEHTAQG